MVLVLALSIGDVTMGATVVAEESMTNVVELQKRVHACIRVGPQ